MGQRLSHFFRLAEPVQPLEPGVYLIQRFRDGLVKIGMSEDLPDRVATILAQCGGEAEVLHLIRTDRPREVEAYFHRILKAARVRGEWFRLTEDDLARLRTFNQWPKRGGFRMSEATTPAPGVQARAGREGRT